MIFFLWIRTIHLLFSFKFRGFFFVIFCYWFFIVLNFYYSIMNLDFSFFNFCYFNDFILIYYFFDFCEIGSIRDWCWYEDVALKVTENRVGFLKFLKIEILFQDLNSMSFQLSLWEKRQFELHFISKEYQFHLQTVFNFFSLQFHLNYVTFHVLLNEEIYVSMFIILYCWATATALTTHYYYILQLQFIMYVLK